MTATSDLVTAVHAWAAYPSEGPDEHDHQAEVLNALVAYDASLTVDDIAALFPALDMSHLPAGYMDEALTFARERGLVGRFVTDLEQLVRDERRVTLFPDGNHSFTFQWYLPNRETGEYEKWIFGGFLFFEAGDSGVGAPQFSVHLGGARESGWYIHT